MSTGPIYLASQSPRRRELLAQIGVTFDVLVADIDETPLSGEAPADYVARLARDKAWAVVRRLQEGGMPLRPVLAADTAVVLDEHILGKPRDREECLDMLRRLSGRRHRVLTAVALARENSVELAVNASQVEFKVLSEREMGGYAASTEPYDKAGGYAIQGRAAAFIQHLEGSYSGVMGLPLYETAQLLARFHIEVI